MPGLFEGAARNWKFVLGFVALSIALWLAQFAYQFYAVSAGDVGSSLVRSFAFTGATMIGASLFSSALFKWVPGLARHIPVRRSLGVVGAFFIFLHVLGALNFMLAWDASLVFVALNPFQNPLIFGMLALPIFAIMALTSTDWAVGRLGFNRWKSVHRLVYVGYLLAVFHFLLVNPPALMNAAGYALIAMTFLAVAGELFWFVKTVWLRKSSPAGVAVGTGIIFLWMLFLYLAYAAG